VQSNILFHNFFSCRSCFDISFRNRIFRSADARSGQRRRWRRDSGGPAQRPTEPTLCGGRAARADTLPFLFILARFRAIGLSSAARDEYATGLTFSRPRLKYLQYKGSANASNFAIRLKIVRLTNGIDVHFIKYDPHAQVCVQPTAPFFGVGNLPEKAIFAWFLGRNRK
jgi:hypothetical protein